MIDDMVLFLLTPQSSDLVIYEHFLVGGGGGPEPGAGDRLDIIEAQGDGSSLRISKITTKKKTMLQLYMVNQI